MLRVISWNNGESARAICNAVSNGKLIRKTDAPLPLPRPTTILVNFGCSEITRQVPDTVLILNPAPAVQVASSKLATFQQLSEYVPWFTTDRNEAVLKSVMEDVSIVCRTIDRGHGGAGIIVKTPEEIQAEGNLPQARVYVKAIKKRREYRVHLGKCVDGGIQIIDVQRKVRRSGVPDGGVNGTDRPFVWNHENEFVFQREGVNRETLPVGVRSRAINAFRLTDLDFAALDIVIEQRTGNVYVLEVNTSPGMEGTTLERYIQFFQHRLTGSSFPLWQGDSSEADHED